MDNDDWQAVLDQAGNPNGSGGDENLTYRILMLGTSGVGKTVYMTTLLHHLMRRDSGLRVTADPALMEEIALNYERICDNEPPPGTARKTNWRFSVSLDEYSLFDFDWIDYRGGALAADELEWKSDDFEEIFDFLKSTVAVFVMADAAEYRRDRQKVEEEIRHITGILDASLERSPRPMHLVLILTKSDEIGLSPDSRDWDRRALLLAGEEIFGGFRGFVSRHPDVMCDFVPVSCYGRSGTRDENGKIVVEDDTEKLRSFQVGIPVMRVFHTILEDVTGRIALLSRETRELGRRHTRNFTGSRMGEIGAVVNPLNHFTSIGKERITAARERSIHFRQQKNHWGELAGHLGRVERSARRVIDSARRTDYVGGAFA